MGRYVVLVLRSSWSAVLSMLVNHAYLSSSTKTKKKKKERKDNRHPQGSSEGFDFLSNLANVLSLPFFRVIDFNSLKKPTRQWRCFVHKLNPRSYSCDLWSVYVLIRFVFGKLSMRVRWIRRQQQLNQYIQIIEVAKRLPKLSMVQVDKSKWLTHAGVSRKANK